MDDDELVQFRRLELDAQTQRASEMIEQYFDGIRFFSGKLAEYNREIGMLDQRLGG